MAKAKRPGQTKEASKGDHANPGDGANEKALQVTNAGAVNNRATQAPASTATPTKSSATNLRKRKANMNNEFAEPAPDISIREREAHAHKKGARDDASGGSNSMTSEPATQGVSDGEGDSDYQDSAPQATPTPSH